jgi:hypothetical protein
VRACQVFEPLLLCTATCYIWGCGEGLVRECDVGENVSIGEVASDEAVNARV